MSYVNAKDTTVRRITTYVLYTVYTVYESFRVESLSLGKIHTHVDSLGVL